MSYLGELYQQGFQDGEEQSIKFFLEGLKKILDGVVTGQQYAGNATALQVQYQRIIELVKKNKAQSA